MVDGFGCGRLEANQTSLADGFVPVLPRSGQEKASSAQSYKSPRAIFHASALAALCPSGKRCNETFHIATGIAVGSALPGWGLHLRSVLMRPRPHPFLHSRPLLGFGPTKPMRSATSAGPSRSTRCRPTRPSSSPLTMATNFMSMARASAATWVRPRKSGNRSSATTSPRAWRRAGTSSASTASTSVGVRGVIAAVRVEMQRPAAARTRHGWNLARGAGRQGGGLLASGICRRAGVARRPGGRADGHGAVG